MQLKRKRSDSEISTSSSLLSSPPSVHTMSMNIDSMDSRINTPSLFASRTRKRHRDNRPDENTIHQNTLSLLYSAQQPSSFAPSEPQPIRLPRPAFQNLANIPVASTNQASLHSFWALPKQRSSSSSSSTDSSSINTPNRTPNYMQLSQAINCEDCDASLNGSEGDGMDIDMDVDMMIGGENHACTNCGKQVCRQCAVSNLGAERKCLGCAGQRRKRWEGGIGWVDAY